MIGLVVVTHGDLAQGLLDAAGMIIGPQAQAAPLAVRREEALETAAERLEQLLARVGSDGDGVIIMTDMFGGTPTNLSLPFCAEGRVEILAGVNLPLLLKFFSSRETRPVAELAAFLRDYGRQGLVLVSEVLAER